MNTSKCNVCKGKGLVTIDSGEQNLCRACQGQGELSQSAKLHVRFKKLNENAVTPTYATDGDAGLDLVATDDGLDTFPADDPANAYYYREYGTGIAVEIPTGYVGLIFPRSSISKSCLHLANAVGVIDSGYRGEIRFRFKIDGFTNVLKGAVGGAAYKSGQKIGQLIIMPYPSVELTESDELSETPRGAQGFGSTGA